MTQSIRNIQKGRGYFWAPTNIGHTCMTHDHPMVKEDSPSCPACETLITHYGQTYYIPKMSPVK